jgi:hypothetical protein
MTRLANRYYYMHASRRSTRQTSAPCISGSKKLSLGLQGVVRRAADISVGMDGRNDASLDHPAFPSSSSIAQGRVAYHLS